MNGPDMAPHLVGHSGVVAGGVGTVMPPPPPQGEGDAWRNGRGDDDASGSGGTPGGGDGGRPVWSAPAGVPKNPHRVKQLRSVLPAPADVRGTGWGEREPWAAHQDGEQGNWKGAPRGRGGELARSKDDYYGMNTNWANAVDPSAFQPSHVFSCGVEGDSKVEFFEDITPETVSRAVRGDWFVTTPTIMGVQVNIRSPDGGIVYTEGPYKETVTTWGTQQDLVLQGAFSFYASQVGTYTIELVNQDPSSPVQLAFAWLLGKDDDDGFVAGAGGGGIAGNKGIVSAAGVNSTLSVLAERVTSLHKKLDNLAALQLYADVRYKRHFETILSTRRRFAWYTVGETAALLLLGVVQVLFIRRLGYKAAPGVLPQSFMGSRV